MRGACRAPTLATALAALSAASACDRTVGGDRDRGAAAEPFDSIANARALAASASLGGRERALAAAASVDARADREGAGVRAMELRMLAGRVIERAWRVYGYDADGAQALRLYREAAAGGRAAGVEATALACEATLAAARIAGDLAHDPTKALAETAAWRPASTGPSSAACSGSIERMRAVLAPFRPPGSPLEDAGLAPGAELAPVALPPAAPVAPPRIVRIDAWPGADAARVAIVLDREAPYRTGDEPAVADHAASTFVDLDGVDLGGAPPELPAKGIMTRVRAESTVTGSRVALDLDGEAWRRTFYMREPYRIIVDVARRPPGEPVHGSPRAVSRVVLDAGHGGRDTGAVGGSGLAEKDVTLDLALRARRILAGEGLDVLLTRDEDRFVSLEERTARANAFGADLFVSLHCNASEGRGRRGVEAYVLDASRDEVVARLAARENATTPAATADLGAMLGRLRLADHAERSKHLAGLLERAAVAAVRMRYPDEPDGGVHAAGFYVLVGARMPSVLLETSYISSPIEEQRLASDDYRQRLADGVANAIRAYREGR